MLEVVWVWKAYLIFPTKNQANEYKMTKKENYKKFTNLSKKELNSKNNKKTSVRNDFMTTIIKRSRDIRALMDLEIN